MDTISKYVYVDTLKTKVSKFSCEEALRKILE